MRQKTILIGLVVIFLASMLYAQGSVRILPLKGPISTAQINPPNGSSVAYLMDFSGQKSICFQNAASTEVFIGSHTAITSTNGWGLYNKGDTLCTDLKGGTTIFFYGNGASADIRAIMVR